MYRSSQASFVQYGIAVALLLGLARPFARAQDPPGTTIAPPPQERTPSQKLKPEDFLSGYEPEGLWDGRTIVPFHSIDNPKMVPAADATFMNDAEYVLALTVNGESRAYPTRIIWFHHAINDTIGKDGAGGSVPVAITYCSVCNTGRRYNTQVNGKTLLVDFYGVYNGVVALRDRETDSVLLQVSGLIITGPRKGLKLKSGPLLDTTWGQWRKLHPDTLVMSPDTPDKRFYHIEPRGYLRFPAPFFRPTVRHTDLRLPAFDKVLAVTIDPTVDSPIASVSTDVKPLATTHGRSLTVLHRAYPIKALEAAGGVINDSLGEMQVGVFLEPKTVTAIAVSRVMDGKTLTFEGRKQDDGTVSIYDKETGTLWNIEGKGETGPLAGKELVRLDNHLSQWYGWVAYFPDTTLYGSNVAPVSGDPFARPDAPTPAAEDSKTPAGDGKKPSPVR